MPTTKKTTPVKKTATKTVKTVAKTAPQKESAKLSVSVFDLAGKETSSMNLPEKIFSVPLSEKLLAQYIRVYHANQRQGTQSTKTRSEIVLSKRKMYRQKGTGKARHGTRAAHIFVGGGVAFAPKPRDYSLGINKKQKRKVLFGALSHALKENKIMGLAESSLEAKPKTSVVAGFLKTKSLQDKRVLLVLPSGKNNLFLASRNLEDITTTQPEILNAYDVMKSDMVVFVQPTVTTLEKHFLKAN